MAERKRMTTRFKELFEQKQFFVMAWDEPHWCQDGGSPGL